MGGVNLDAIVTAAANEMQVSPPALATQASSLPLAVLTETAFRRTLFVAIRHSRFLIRGIFADELPTFSQLFTANSGFLRSPTADMEMRRVFP